MDGLYELEAWNINLISEKKKKDRLEIYVPLFLEDVVGSMV